MLQPLGNPVMCGETWQHCNFRERTYVEFKEFLRFTAKRFRVLNKSIPKESEAHKALNEAIKRFQAAHLFFYREGIPELKDFYDEPTRMHGMRAIKNKKNKLVGV